MASVVSHVRENPAQAQTSYVAGPRTPPAPPAQAQASYVGVPQASVLQAASKDFIKLDGGRKIERASHRNEYQTCGRIDLDRCRCLLRGDDATAQQMLLGQ